MIYFVRSETSNYVKIGYSANPPARLRSLQTGSPEKLYIEAIFPGEQKDEKAFHHLLRANRVHGEWFQDNDDLKFLLKILNQNKESNTRLEALDETLANQNFNITLAGSHAADAMDILIKDPCQAWECLSNIYRLGFGIEPSPRLLATYPQGLRK